MTTQQEVIRAFMKSLDTTMLKGSEALDEAVKACSQFGSLQNLIDKLISDCSVAKSADDFLKNYCGIDLDNDDTGAITGWDAGGSKVKTARSIVPESGAASYPSDTSFTKRGLTVIVPNKNTLTIDQQTVVRGLYSWWIDEGLNLIEESYSYSFTDSDATVTEITLEFHDYSSLSSAAKVASHSKKGKTTELTLMINMDVFGDISEDNVDGQITKSFYLDRTIAHELTHAIMRSKIDNYSELPKFLREGMAELTHGIDDKRNTLIKELASDSSQLAKYLNPDSDDLGNNSEGYVAGYILLRYLAKQTLITGSSDTLTVSNSTKSPVTVSADVKVIDASKRTSAIKITGNTLANTIRGGSGADSIFGGGGNDSILGNAGNDKLFGEDGNDTLDGGNGNDTLTGGDGNDVFVYSAGKDVITDYASGDKISLGAAISKSSVSGSNVVLTIGSGTLTVNNAKGKTLSMIDAKGKSFSTVVGTSDTLTVSNSTKSPVTVSADVKVIDAAKRTSAVKITGNGLANTISGGSKNDSLFGAAGNDSILGNNGNDKLFGDAGNDTLHGSAGNDTLTGGAGNDVFIYSAGKDVIADYATGDKISIGAAISKSTVSGSNVVLTIGSGTLTVNNAKGKTLSMIDAKGKSFSTVVGNDTLTVTNSTKSPVTVSADVKVIDAAKRTSAVKITGNGLANTISGGSKNDSLFGAAGNDSILGGAGNDKLFGDAGNDTLDGGNGNDTLTGGDGNDVFIYSAGKDVIADYATGDKISIGAAIIKSTVSGSNVILTIGSGTLTVNNAKGKSLSMIDAKGKSFSTVVGNDTLTVSNSTKSPVTVSADVKVIDAAKRTSAVKITGNSLANTISGGSKNDSLFGAAGNDSILGNNGNDKLFGDAGKDILRGGAGNDTLTGGAGNDSLWGDAGKDTFLYSSGDGKDVIFGFENNDLLQITGTFSASYNKSKKEVAFKVGSTANAITLRDFTATSFHVNGDTYSISNNKFIKK